MGRLCSMGPWGGFGGAALLLHSPVVAPGLWGVSGDVPTVPVAVPGGWLGVGVLLGTPVLGCEGVVVSVVVSRGVVEVGAVGREGLPLPGGVMLSGVVTAGPLLALAPSAVPSEVEGRDVE